MNDHFESQAQKEAATCAHGHPRAAWVLPSVQTPHGFTPATGMFKDEAATIPHGDFRTMMIRAPLRAEGRYVDGGKMAYGTTTMTVAGLSDKRVRRPGLGRHATAMGLTSQCCSLEDTTQRSSIGPAREPGVGPPTPGSSI